MNFSKWHHDDLKTLKTMTNEGASDAEIAIKLGLKTSQVKSKRHQLRLVKRVTIDWTDEKMQLIKDMYLKNHTMTEIANAFSEKYEHVTRNSIAGKVHRMGLSSRANTKKVLKSNSVVDLPILKPVESDILFRDAMPHHCRYMTSGGANSPICGKDKVKGSYCEEHHALCLRPVRNREETDADIEEHRKKTQSWEGRVV